MKKDQFVLARWLHSDKKKHTFFCIELAIDDMHVIGGSALPQKENLKLCAFQATALLCIYHIAHNVEYDGISDVGMEFHLF